MTDFDLDTEVITRVREAADIIAVVSDQVRLKRRGGKWIGLCPFHEEKTPSFTVDAEKGFYHCFGCKAGGDVFNFVMAQQNFNFPEAVEYLARRFGVNLPARSPGAQKRRHESERQRAILEEAQRWFVEQLHSAGGVEAARELDKRGFPQSSWSDFGFGWAPDEWRGLVDHLRARHPEGVLAQAGLIVQPESGKSPYDRFRKRLMFPIRSGDGRLIAFGGRILGDGEPKYLNSPESTLFHKRSTLFALDRARKAISSSGEVIVVEGYFDCLSLHRVGLVNVVATLGTALTPEHGRSLRRLLGEDGRVLLCYDADSAGQRAAATGAGVLLQAGIDVAMITIEGGKDPDDIIRDGGIEAFNSMASRPTSLLDFLLANMPPDPAERRRAGLDLAPLVCSAANPAYRQNLIDELARRLNLRPRDIESKGRTPGARGGPPPASGPTTPQAATAPGEMDLARILLEGSAVIRAKATEDVIPELIEDVRVRGLLSLVLEWGPDQEIATRVMAESQNEDLRNLVAQLCTSEHPPVTEERAALTLALVVRRQEKEAARSLQQAIEQASRDGNFERVAELQAEKIRLRSRTK
ncbi:MAG: DNA primase [Acidobacteria bacterium]|nr:MAG: DNA primase [Acidobacteriota bacterium]